MRFGTVYIGSRDAERGWREAEQLGARAVQLDITDDVSVHSAVKTIEADRGLDVLVNNAGVEERGDNNVVIGPADVTVDVMRKTFESNVFGTVRVLHAFLPLLQRSGNPVVVNVSSGLGSLTQVAAPVSIYPGVAYPASKAAVNMITVQFAKAFPNMRINAVDPGFTKTDLNGNTASKPSSRAPRSSCAWRRSGPMAPPAATSTPTAPFPGDPKRHLTSVAHERQRNRSCSDRRRRR